MVRSATGLISGGSATGFTTSTKPSLRLKAPSETVTVMVEEPVALARGVTVTVRLAPVPPNTTLAGGTKAGLLEVAESASTLTSLSTSPTEKGIAPVEASSLMVRSVRSPSVGRSFTERTVSTKLSCARSVPSVTITVRVAVPERLEAGRTVTVRLPPEPPKTMLPTGTRVGLLEVADKTSEARGLSGSATVNAIVPVETSSLTERSEMLLMVGARLLSAGGVVYSTSFENSLS